MGVSADSSSEEGFSSGEGNNGIYNQFPSNYNPTPSIPNQYPSNFNQYPSNNNQYPSNNNQYPSNNNQYPSNYNQYPYNYNQYPYFGGNNQGNLPQSLQALFASGSGFGQNPVPTGQATRT